MASIEAGARTARACPGCRSRMQRQAFDRKPVGRVDLDFCFGCHAIWFDQYESAQLTPGGVLELFRLIHEHRDAPRIPVADNLHCPACRGKLQLTHDIQRTNRITYHRCAAGHGRWTTFFQFLREKNFVRSLTAAEIERLKVHIAQVRCSGCGAPVDLARDSQCAYCRSPISILDAEAVKKTLAELDEQERKRKTVDPAAAIEGLLAGQRFERKVSRMEGRITPFPKGSPEADWVDLVGEALDFLMNGAKP
jgi:DNA-directed RNA polymerase subunit RPC12/RpoP